jgi:hypothetical protein
MSPTITVKVQREPFDAIAAEIGGAVAKAAPTSARW